MPVPVLTTTGTDGDGERPAGTVATQVVVLGHDTEACTPAKVAVMTPDGLNRFDPERVTVCPTVAELGVMDDTTGAPGTAAVLGGAAVVGAAVVGGGAVGVVVAPAGGFPVAAVRR